MLSDIDLTLKPQKINIFLCKPNKQIVAKLTEAYNVNLILKLGNLNELTFDLPYEIDLHHELHRNEYIDELRERYLLKVIYNEYHEEFFIINEISELGNDARECKNIHAFSLGYELADKQLKNYKCTPSNASQVLADALSKTIWSVGYIDAAFDLKYRSFEVSTKTILDFVWEIAETFQALILWDTANRKINFYQPEAIGHNRGLKIKYGKYLNSLDKKIYTDEMVTRLIVLGKDGLSIQRINPTGTNYLEDFSYFMYPYEEDQNGNTVTSSYYMSDELCHAIINYKQLIESKRDTFENLISQRSAHEETLTSLNKELADLQAELNKILDDIDIAQALGKDISTYKPDGYTVFLEEARNNKQADVAAQQTEIADAESSLNIVDNQVSDLRNVLSAENNFTPEQLQERNQFIIEKEWSDENYTADEELYKDALKVFADLRTPQTVIEIDIVNFLEILEEQRNWDKLKLGDIITVQYEKLNIDIQAKISEVVFDCENSTVKITITNVKDLKTNEDRLLNMLYQSASTSTTVDMNKFKWNDTVDSMNSVSQLLNGVWDSAKRSINAGVNESVTIDRRGITVTDPFDPLKFLRATHGVIGLTSDGGNNYKVAMDGSGVYAQRLVGNLIAGNDLKIITNSNGSFSVDGKGVTIKGASLTITEGLPENQINSTSVGKWNSAEANAKNYVNQQITEVNTSISQLENDVNNMLSDSKITAIEANTLKTSLNQVVAESTDLINVAGSLGITTEKTNYSNAINDLNSYLTGNWIDQANYPKTITSSQRNTIQNKFKTVQNVKSILINKITAIREQNAKNYAVGKGVTYNGVKIDTANGLTVTKSDNKVRTILNATSGIKIQTNNGSSWTDKFFADTNGDLTLKGNVTIGSGNTLFKADNNGISLGSSNFAYAPFKVNMSGKLTAYNADIKGIIDCQDLKINGSSILTNNRISTNYIEDLVVGGNVTMGPNATISWNNVTSQPKIPTIPDYIKSTKITHASIESPMIIGGTIIGGSVKSDSIIDVTTDVKIGHNLYLLEPATSFESGIYWGNKNTFTAVIRYDPGGALCITSNNLTIDSNDTKNGQISITSKKVTINGNDVTNGCVAKFG